MSTQRIGPYIIEEKIGSGGMGTVFRARHAETGEPAAVKVLPPALAREEGFVLRFAREVEALEKLHNPHIVQLLSSGVEQETCYFAMEFVTGETLAQRLLRERRIPWRQAVNIALQLCVALKAAHDAGVIHRDLKPSNILLSEDGTVKLTDFGVAQLFAAEKLTMTGGVVGTAEYMSPEQAQGQRATKRSDLYSLGAVLYVMLTGRPPFSGASAVDVLQKHRYGQFDLPSRYASDIPSWLDEVIEQLLEKNPDNRLPDAHVAARRLQEVMKKVELRESGGETAIAADDPGATGESPRPMNATRSRAALRDDAAADPGAWAHRIFNSTTTLVAILMLLAAGVWWFESRRLSPEQHLAAARLLLDQPAGPDWIVARDNHLKPLLDSDPKRWEADVQPLLAEIELYELEQKLSPKRRGRNRIPQSEPERLMADIKRLWEQGQLAEAERRLHAVELLLAGDPKNASLAKLASKWQEALSEAQAQHPSAAEYVKSVLQRAEALAKSDPDAARGLWLSVIELYRDDPAAAAEVAEAEQRLGEVRR